MSSAIATVPPNPAATIGVSTGAKPAGQPEPTEAFGRIAPDHPRAEQAEHLPGTVVPRGPGPVKAGDAPGLRREHYDGALIADPNHQESRPTWSGLPVMNGAA